MFLFKVERRGEKKLYIYMYTYICNVKQKFLLLWLKVFLKERAYRAIASKNKKSGWWARGLNQRQQHRAARAPWPRPGATRLSKRMSDIRRSGRMDPGCRHGGGRRSSGHARDGRRAREDQGVVCSFGSVVGNVLRCSGLSKKQRRLPRLFLENLGNSHLDVNSELKHAHRNVSSLVRWPQLLPG